MLKKYTTETEEKMKQYYDGLNEKEKRHYAAVEAIKLGHGSKTYIAGIVKCDRKTIAKGIKELDKLELTFGRVRKSGGGRKNIIDNIPEIETIFNKVIEKYTAGSPMSETIWTHLEPVEISELMSKEKEGLKVSPYTVKQLLKKNDYKYRKMQKDAIMSEPEDRDAQFLKIEKLKAEYEKSDNPIISIDVKKKSK